MVLFILDIALKNCPSHSMRLLQTIAFENDDNDNDVCADYYGCYRLL